MERRETSNLALATGTVSACCFLRLDMSSSGYLLLVNRKPKKKGFFWSWVVKFHDDLEEIETLASSDDLKLQEQLCIS